MTGTSLMMYMLRFLKATELIWQIYYDLVIVINISIKLLTSTLVNKWIPLSFESIWMKPTTNSSCFLAAFKKMWSVYWKSNAPLLWPTSLLHYTNNKSQNLFNIDWDWSRFTLNRRHTKRTEQTTYIEHFLCLCYYCMFNSIHPLFSAPVSIHSSSQTTVR